MPVYFDSAATTQVDSRVAALVMEYMTAQLLEQGLVSVLFVDGAVVVRFQEPPPSFSSLSSSSSSSPFSALTLPPRKSMTSPSKQGGSGIKKSSKSIKSPTSSPVKKKALAAATKSGK